MAEIPNIVLVDFEALACTSGGERTKVDYPIGLVAAPFAINGINRLRQHGIVPVAHDRDWMLTEAEKVARQQWLKDHFSGPFGEWALGCCSETNLSSEILGRISTPNKAPDEPFSLTFTHMHGNAIEQAQLNGWIDKGLLRALGTARRAYQTAAGETILVPIDELQATA